MVNGGKQSFVAFLGERSTRFLLLITLSGEAAGSAVVALTDGFQTLPAQLKRGLTWGRGPEGLRPVSSANRGWRGLASR